MSGKSGNHSRQDNGGCLVFSLYSVFPISVSLIKNTEREAERLTKPCGPRKTPFYSTEKGVAIFA